MAEESLPASKAELVELIDKSWAELMSLVDSLPPDRLAAKGPEGWAVKDHLAHLAVWERMAVAAVKGESQWAASGIDEWEGEWDLDRFNNLLYQTWRDADPAQARAYLEQSHRQMMDLIAPMDDATLQADMPNEPGRPNVDKIAGNTYWHFDEHREWISQLLARL